MGRRVRWMEGLCRYLKVAVGVEYLWDKGVSVGSISVHQLALGWPAGGLGTRGLGECHVYTHMSDFLSLPAQEEEGMELFVLLSVLEAGL